MDAGLWQQGARSAEHTCFFRMKGRPAALRESTPLSERSELTSRSARPRRDAEEPPAELARHGLRVLPNDDLDRIYEARLAQRTLRVSTQTKQNVDGRHGRHRYPRSLQDPRDPQRAKRTVLACNQASSESNELAPCSNTMSPEARPAPVFRLRSPSSRPARPTRSAASSTARRRVLMDARVSACADTISPDNRSSRAP